MRNNAIQIQLYLQTQCRRRYQRESATTVKYTTTFLRTSVTVADILQYWIVTETQSTLKVSNKLVSLSATTQQRNEQ